ncbi:MAG: tRNA 2-selenouridine(34) synthase MnmH, partial [Deltaproteobacteria bacterium]|nr:tRNA 2-selenouridine(34) synthase MnmH [Deltaproteobacteria bacterium]
YAEATIPGAVNVPILNNAERAEIGTLYKREGKLIARRRGVEIVAPKIPVLVERVAEMRASETSLAVVFCWRGGLRSRAMAQFLDLAGIPARQMAGGHKRFRQHVLRFFSEAEWGRMIVLRGLTGVGKTRILNNLAAKGHEVIDLEGLASHRGSAFGNLDLPAQPTQKMFEALLWDRLQRIPPTSHVLVEGESRWIGRLQLPVRVYQAMQQETCIWLNASLATRVNNLLEDYSALTEAKERFVEPIQALKERLGAQAVEELLSYLDRGAWDDLVRELMTRYYDPLYRHKQPKECIEVNVESLGAGLDAVLDAVTQVLAPVSER